MAESKKKILIIMPLKRDFVELKALEHKYDFIFDRSFDWLDDVFLNLAEHKSKDIIKTIEEATDRYRDGAHTDIDAVFSSCDFGVAISSILASALGLPCTNPRNMLLTHHKYYQRLTIQEIEPEVNPGFRIYDPTVENPVVPREYPFFMKPVKSVLSSHAYKIANDADFARAMRNPIPSVSFSKHFTDMLRHCAPEAEHDCCKVMCEDAMSGDQCTLDGFVCNGEIQIIGIIDSIMYPGTNSFASFEYPSRLPEGIQTKAREVATKVVRGLGLDNTTFNIEFFYNSSTGELKIIEVNPRFSGQFGDLYEKVWGTNTYTVALELACGRKPELNLGGAKYTHASSFVQRIFENKYIESVPTDEQIDAVQKLHKDSIVFVLVKPNSKLSDYIQDATSFRFCLVHLGANSFDELYAKYEQCKGMLPFGFKNL